MDVDVGMGVFVETTTSGVKAMAEVGFNAGVTTKLQLARKNRVNRIMRVLFMFAPQFMARFQLI